MRILPFLLIFATLVALPAHSQDLPPGVKTGIEGQPAPPLGVPKWINLPEGRFRLGLPDFRDKVLVLFLWQSTCSACQNREFPVLQQLVKEFEGNEDVAFLAIQTPFENYTDNNELKLEPTAKKFGLDIPFGHLAKTQDGANINERYQTAGTPWWVVIDKKGIVVFNGMTMNPDVASENIRKLVADESIE